MPQEIKNQVELPPSQKEAAKTTSTGTTKSPTTGNTTPATSNAKPTGVITGDKTTPKTEDKPPEGDKKAEQNKEAQPNAESKKEPAEIEAIKAAEDAAEEQKTAEQKQQKDDGELEPNFSKIEGEVLQGDSFRISVTRGNTTLNIPVPLESSRDVITLANTFRIIGDIGKAKNRKELDEKFHAFIAQ